MREPRRRAARSSAESFIRALGEATAGTSPLQGSAALEALNLSALRTVGGDFKVYDHASLASLSLDALEAVGLNFQVSFTPALRHAWRYFYVTQNPMLPLCEVQAILAALEEDPVYLVSSHNDEEAVCLP